MLPMVLAAAFVVLAFAGHFGCVMTAGRAENWLCANDPDFEPSGLWGRRALVRMFMSRTFTGIGTMTRYRRARRARGEPTTLVTVFWICFVASIAWPFGLIAIAELI